MAGAKLDGVEASAISLLKRAVEMDNERQFSQALTCYQEGIQLLLDVLKGTKDEAKKQRFRQRIEEYMERAEKLKEHVDQNKEAAKYHEQIHIEENAVGYSYERIFDKFLDSMITVVEVEDAYIRSIHQFYNFLRFCELLIKKTSVKSIKLVTGPEEREQAYHDQAMRLEELAKSLHKHNVQLEVVYSRTLHDREIRFNNGWVVKIGRGLDYFKPSGGKYTVGHCDFDLRHCHATTIDIFHSSQNKLDS